VENCPCNGSCIYLNAEVSYSKKINLPCVKFRIDVALCTLGDLHLVLVTRYTLLFSKTAKI